MWCICHTWTRNIIIIRPLVLHRSLVWTHNEIQLYASHQTTNLQNTRRKKHCVGFSPAASLRRHRRFPTTLKTALKHNSVQSSPQLEWKIVKSLLISNPPKHTAAAGRPLHCTLHVQKTFDLKSVWQQLLVLLLDLGRVLKLLSQALHYSKFSRQQLLLLVTVPFWIRKPLLLLSDTFNWHNLLTTAIEWLSQRKSVNQEHRGSVW